MGAWRVCFSPQRNLPSPGTAQRAPRAEHTADTPCVLGSPEPPIPPRVSCSCPSQV